MEWIACRHKQHFFINDKPACRSNDKPVKTGVKKKCKTCEVFAMSERFESELSKHANELKEIE